MTLYMITFLRNLSYLIANPPLNLNVMRKTTLPLLKAADFGRIGIKKKMFRAALSIPSLEYILTGQK